MAKQRFFVALAALCLSTSVFARSSDNPFEKGVNVDIGRDAAWTVTDKTATRSGSGEGAFYHLLYDRKQLRLRITGSAEDSDASAKNYDQFAVNDVLLDGKRLPVFQWCLNNQDRHKRFLQQGLSVKKDVCKNKGEVGVFSMRLNAATLDMLKKGKKLTYDLKPYRTDIEVTFDISDFSDVAEKLSSGRAPVAAKPKTKPAPAPVAPAKKCKASPPAGFAEVKAVEYSCGDAAAKAKATASVDAAVSKERDNRKKVAAEREKKRLAAEKAKAAEQAAQKAAEEKLAAEQAALAASAAQQQAISSEIADKMISMCKKKWDKGEHRCYCEKYIEHAPKAIQEGSTCPGS